MSRVVSDASPLIALHQIGQLSILAMPLIGTLGILLAAKRRELLPSVREAIDSLRRGGFRVANDLYQDVLRRAGELPE